MRFLTKLNQYFGFTPTESKVVYFIVLAFIAGSAVKLYRTYFPLAAAPGYDYSEAEKEFASRSTAIDSLEELMVEPTNLAQGPTIKSLSESPSTSRDNKETKKSPTAKAVNLNTASKEELISIPGIGEVMAERILVYRKNKGKFRRIEELRNVQGIGEKTLEKLRAFVKVD